MSSIIVPERLETATIRRGRDVGARMEFAVRNERARGNKPYRIRISQGSAQALHEFFGFACASYDGVLPPKCRGVPVVVEPGDETAVTVDVTRE